MLNKKTTQPALSIIEILVAISLISLILTALSINMVYTQRSVKDAQLRAQATDQAETCLNRFRNLRDANSWALFCQRLESINPPSPDQPNIITATFDDSNGVTQNPEVCNIASSVQTGSQQNNTVTVTLNRVNGVGDVCTAASGEDEERAEVVVAVHYTNFHGDPRTVQLSQNFARAAHEANYRLLF